MSEASGSGESVMQPWVQQFQLHSYHVDLKRVASLESVCRFFLEAAWNHAEELGFGYGSLAQHGKLWVLSRLLVKIQRYPAWGESVSVLTWPRGPRSVFAMRDFELQDSAGAVIGSGASAWLILDAATRRPQRLEKFLEKMPTLSERRALAEDPGKLPDWSQDGAEVSPVRVRYSDIDVNSHLNSCRYVGLILDSYPLEFHAHHSPVFLEINYLGETHGGEEIQVLRAPSSGNEFQHRMLKSRGAQEICRAQLTWQPLS